MHVITREPIGSERVRLFEGPLAAAELLTMRKSNSLGSLHNPTNDQFDVWHVLVDCSTGERLERKPMKRAKAQKLNQLLKGTGFAWSMCS